MASNRLANGCLVAGGVLLAVITVVGGLGLVAAAFLFRVESSSDPVDRDFTITLEKVDGRLEMWADLQDNCIGVTVNDIDGAACDDRDVVSAEIPVGDQVWAVSMSEVGVALEPTDHECIEGTRQVERGHNLSWCRLR